MDKIYSRRRIKIFYSDSKEIKKKIILTVIIVSAIITVAFSVQSINPIFEELCIEKAKTVATNILNIESSKVLKEYDYKDIISTIHNESDNTNILRTDVTVINNIASEIATQITKKFQDIEKDNIKIPIGALAGNKFTSGMGPGINISVIPSKTVDTELKTEFKAQGINQTVYRIYLQVVCHVNVISSYKTIETDVVNQVLLVETVIVGGVPETYYNLEGVDKESSIDIIE